MTRRWSRSCPGTSTGTCWTSSPACSWTPSATATAPTAARTGSSPNSVQLTRERLQNTLLSWSIDLLSGPAGFPAYLRRHLLPARFTSLSQPLDLGRTTRVIPPHLRKAVIQRDKKCRFPGCEQPPSVCQVHHLIPWAQGGATALGNLALFCDFTTLSSFTAGAGPSPATPTAPPPPPHPTDASSTPTDHPPPSREPTPGQSGWSVSVLLSPGPAMVTLSGRRGRGRRPRAAGYRSSRCRSSGGTGCGTGQ